MSYDAERILEILVRGGLKEILTDLQSLAESQMRIADAMERIANATSKKEKVSDKNKSNFSSEEEKELEEMKALLDFF